MTLTENTPPMILSVKLMHDCILEVLIFCKQVVPTWASAMDIQIPYNVERMLLAVTDVDIEAVSAVMNEFDKHLKVKVPDQMMDKIRQLVVDTEAVDRKQVHSVFSSYLLIKRIPSRIMGWLVNFNPK